MTPRTLDDGHTSALDYESASGNIVSALRSIRSQANRAARNQESAPMGLFTPLTTPLTSTAWDGDTISTSDTIDLSEVFGVPADVIAIAGRLSVASNVKGQWCGVGPGSATCSALKAMSNGDTAVWASCAGVVPCDERGDIYIYVSGTINVQFEIWGYWAGSE